MPSTSPFCVAVALSGCSILVNVIGWFSESTSLFNTGYSTTVTSSSVVVSSGYALIGPLLHSIITVTVASFEVNWSSSTSTYNVSWIVGCGAIWTQISGSGVYLISSGPVGSAVP